MKTRRTRSWKKQLEQRLCPADGAGAAKSAPSERLRRPRKRPVPITVSGGTFTSGWRSLGELSSCFPCALLVEVPDVALRLWSLRRIGHKFPDNLSAAAISMSFAAGGAVSNIQNLRCC